MVRDRFTGQPLVPSTCCGAGIIPSSGPGWSWPACSNCGEPVREKDKVEKSYRLTSDQYVDLSKDWYFVQGLHANIPGKNSGDVVVFAKTLPEAKAKAEPWAAANQIGELHFYRNNYKPDARALIRAGKVIK